MRVAAQNAEISAGARRFLSIHKEVGGGFPAAPPSPRARRPVPRPGRCEASQAAARPWEGIGDPPLDLATSYTGSPFFRLSGWGPRARPSLGLF